jgi:hypothetical protein
MKNQEEASEEESGQEVMMLRFQLLIPENEYGIEEGYYIGNALVQLLRDNKNKPDVIQFIADMLEE